MVPSGRIPRTPRFAAGLTRWLVPGLHVKRWLGVTIVAVVAISLGISYAVGTLLTGPVYMWFIRRIQGSPDPRYVSTSYIERQNLIMRMGMRRFTRLTNGFSKKAENLSAAVSLHFMHYNFARPHKGLANPYPRTPAMAAGVTDHVWSVTEMVELLG